MKESGKERLKYVVYESTLSTAAVLAFVISHTTFLAAQDDETGRCLKVVFQSPVTRDW